MWSGDAWFSISNVILSTGYHIDLFYCLYFPTSVLYAPDKVASFVLSGHSELFFVLIEDDLKIAKYKSLIIVVFSLVIGVAPANMFVSRDKLSGDLQFFLGR